VYGKVQELLNSREFGILSARDGYLLLKKGLFGEAATRLPGEFYTFAHADEETIPYPLHARFGDGLELLGYDYSILNVVHAHQLPATVTTYWRPLRPLASNHLLAFFFTRQDGAVVYQYIGRTPTTMWYPIHIWQEGEVIRVETPILSVGQLKDAMVAVMLPTSDDPAYIPGRLQPIEGNESQALEIFEEGTLLKLFSFP
jgi:hypothetical protein